MSSEMRELIEKWRKKAHEAELESASYIEQGDQAESRVWEEECAVFSRCADELEALLARTEADYSACCDTPNFCSSVRRCVAKDVAKLARTEAGADGAVAWGVEFKGAINYADVRKSSVEDEASVYGTGAHARVVPLYTRPQDASGEAWKCYVGEMPTSSGMRYVVTVERESEQAKNFWDRTRITPYIFGDGERYKAEYEAACLSAFLNNTPYPDILAFNPDAAMQAKEAK